MPDLDRLGGFIDLVDGAVLPDPEAMKPRCPEWKRLRWPWLTGERIDSLEKVT
jgi:hypothetical protein